MTYHLKTTTTTTTTTEEHNRTGTCKKSLSWWAMSTDTTKIPEMKHLQISLDQYGVHNSNWNHL